MTLCTSCGIGLTFSWGGRPTYGNRPWYYDDYGMGFGGPRFTIGSNGFFGNGMSSYNVHHHHHHYYDKDGKYKYRYSKDPPSGNSGYGGSGIGGGTGTYSSGFGGGVGTSPFWRFFSNLKK